MRTQSLSHFPSSRTRLQKQCELVTGLAFNDQHRQSLSQYFVKNPSQGRRICMVWSVWEIFIFDVEVVVSLVENYFIHFFHPSFFSFSPLLWFTPRLQRISRHTSFRSTEPSSFSQISVCVRVRMCMHACVHVFFLLYIDSRLNPHSLIKVPIFNIIIIFNN